MAVLSSLVWAAVAAPALLAWILLLPGVVTQDFSFGESTFFVWRAELWAGLCFLFIATMAFTLLYRAFRAARGENAFERAVKRAIASEAPD